MSRRQQVRVWFGVIALLNVVACQGLQTPAPKLADDSLLKLEPCLPPCWQGLTPGVTSLEEAYTFLESSPLIEGNVGERNTVSTGGLVQAWWWAGEKQDYDRQNVFDFNGDNILTNIILVPNTDIPIGDIMVTFGTPTLMTFAVNGPRDNFASGPTGVLMSALFTGNSFEVAWFEELNLDSSPVQFCFSPNTLVIEVAYKAPELMRAKEVSLRSAGTDTGGIIVEGNTVAEIRNQQVIINCVNLP